MISFLALAAQTPTSSTPAGVRLELSLGCPESDPSGRFYYDPAAERFHLRYVNGGTVPIDLAEGAFYFSGWLVVRDEKGHVPALTERGQSELRSVNAYPGSLPRSSVGHRTLSPGGTYETGLGTVPGWKYVLVPGQRYTATIEYRSMLGTPLHLFSNPVAFVARALTPPKYAPEGPPPPAPRGLRLELSPVKHDKDSRLGHTNYRLTFFNDALNGVMIHWGSFWSNHLVILRDAQGQEPTPRLTGYGFHMGLWDFGNRDHDTPQTIYRGQSFGEVVGIDPDELYRLEPGTYTLQVQYYEQMNERMSLLSNTVEFIEPLASGR